jgi:hypothetical protein
MQAEDEAHLCPIRALAEWVKVSRINKGYLFRRIWSGDRVADLDKNTPMVSFHNHIKLSLDTEYDYRHQSSSWNCSEIISLTSILTTSHTELTLSDEVDVSILLPIADGHSEGSVTGEDGALNSPT